MDIRVSSTKATMVMARTLITTKSLLRGYIHPNDQAAVVSS